MAKKDLVIGVILFSVLVYGRIKEELDAVEEMRELMAKAVWKSRAINETLTSYNIKDRQIECWIDEAEKARTVRGTLVLLEAVKRRVEEIKFKRLVVDEM